MGNVKCNFMLCVLSAADIATRYKVESLSFDFMELYGFRRFFFITLVNLVFFFSVLYSKKILLSYSL